MKKNELAELKAEIDKMTKDEAKAALHDGTNSHKVYTKGDRNVVTALLRGKVRAKDPS